MWPLEALTPMTSALIAFPEPDSTAPGSIPPVLALASLDPAATTPAALARWASDLFRLEPIPSAIWWHSRACLTATNCTLRPPTICVVALGSWFTAETALVTLRKDASLSRIRTLATWSSLVRHWRSLLKSSINLSYYRTFDFNAFLQQLQQQQFYLVHPSKKY